jgi:hypothetical protein
MPRAKWTELLVNQKAQEKFGEYTRRIYRLLGME